MSLNLVPNEIVGYRIKPDWHSFTVVLVKRKGAASKDAGQEYDTTLAHCKNLEFAASWIVSHASRMHGELAQTDCQAVRGTVADAQALAEAFVKAKAEALDAVAELTARLEKAGILEKTLVRRLGNEPPQNQEDAANLGEAETGQA